MLQNIKYRNNYSLIFIGLVIFLALEVCYSEESHQPDKSHQLNEGHQLNESLQSENTSLTENNSSTDETIQAENNAPGKSAYSFLSQAKDSSIGKKDLASPMDALSVTLGLIFILLLIFLFAWILRKMGYSQFNGQGALSILATLNLGQKEKITLIKVGEKQILIGITASQINTLHVLDEPIDIKTSRTTAEKNVFAAKLSDVLNSSKEKKS